MSLADAGGLFGVVLTLIGYAGVTSGRLDPLKWPALVLNLLGAGLVLISLVFDFNLAAFVTEAAWVMIALFGLVRLAIRPR